jgi:hypothetical protein
MKIIINCSKPRLSDEEMDPIEQDDVDGVSNNQSEGWLPWDLDDLIDIKRIIDERMPFKQKQVIEAFLAGMSFTDMGMTEKYWRYHYDKAVEFIQKELGA